MPSQTNDVEYPSAEEENRTLNKIDDAVRSKDWSKVCYEVGVFIEKLTEAAYKGLQDRSPKNFRVAIDFLMDNGWVPRSLIALSQVRPHLVTPRRSKPDFDPRFGRWPSRL